VPGLYVRGSRDGQTVRDVFEARLRLNGGPTKRVTLDATTKTDAIAELAALRVDRRRGDPVKTGSLVPTVAEVAADWLASLQLRVGHRDASKRYSPRTVDLYRQRIGAHVLPRLGSIPIDELTADDVRRLIDRLGTKLAPSTVTSVVSMLSGLMRFAMRERLVARNPIRDLDRLDRPGVKRLSEPRYLSVDEIELLLAATSDTFRPVAATCTFAALRISEALGLKWGNVSFERGTIRVCRQLDDDLTLRPVTKKPSSTATIPLLPRLARELRAHCSRQASVDLRLVHRDALIFTTTNGKPQTRRNALRALHTAGDSVGLNGENPQPVGLHDLRHSLVALSLDSQMTIAEVAVLVRHANARVTGQLYAGLSDKAKAGLASKLVQAGIGS
jgi:integrase